jgi:hypothetical protein
LLVNHYGELSVGVASQQEISLKKALIKDNLTAFFDTINRLYASIPSYLHEKSEAYYHSLFIAACGMAGVTVDTEIPSSMGRADAILTSPTTTYIIEFKIDKSPEEAIQQIIDKRYGERFLGQGKPVIPVGVSFSIKERRITAWKTGKAT